MDLFSFFVGTRTETEIYEIMHMHLFGFSVGKVEVPAQPGGADMLSFNRHARQLEQGKAQHSTTLQRT